MKRRLFILVLIAACFSFCACGNNQSNVADNITDTESEILVIGETSSDKTDTRSTKSDISSGASGNSTSDGNVESAIDDTHTEDSNTNANSSVNSGTGISTSDNTSVHSISDSSASTQTNSGASTDNGSNTSIDNGSNAGIDNGSNVSTDNGSNAGTDNNSGSSSNDNNQSSASENAPDVWEVTSYADKTGSQAMFYTICNRHRNKLVVIDGGNTGNADYVEEIIKGLGGHVDAWIITHYHADHVDAFNEIFDRNDGISIDTIYCPPIDYEKYKSVANWWDSVSSFELFLSRTSGDSRVRYLNRGDTFTIDALTFEIFNSYDETTMNMGDMPNNAALAFRVQAAGGKSMFFCSDVNSLEQSQILINRYGSRLKSNYLQPGHHGNNSFDTAFYDAVSPEAVVFDAPEWLMTGSEYKTKRCIDWCTSHGVSYYSYINAPNTLYL